MDKFHTHDKVFSNKDEYIIRVWTQIYWLRWKFFILMIVRELLLNLSYNENDISNNFYKKVLDDKYFCFQL